jgi:FixJ family two-component response regulator
MAEAPHSPPLVVVVDDDESMRRSLGRLLRSGGLAFESFATGEALLEALDALEPRCAVVDVHLPGMGGLDVQRALRGRRPELPVLLITGYDEPEARQRALAAGAVGFLLKPFPRSDLLGTVLAAIESGATPAGKPTRTTRRVVDCILRRRRTMTSGTSRTRGRPPLRSPRTSARPSTAATCSSSTCRSSGSPTRPAWVAKRWCAGDAAGSSCRPPSSCLGSSRRRWPGGSPTG